MARILIALYVLTTSSALITLKYGAKAAAPISFIDGRVHLNLNPYVIIGFALYGTSFLIYTYLISKFDLGYIIPLTTAFVYVGIFLASYFIFKEAFTAIKITGIAFILIGISLLSFHK